MVGKNNQEIISIKIGAEIESLEQIEKLFFSVEKGNTIQLCEGNVKLEILSAGNTLSFGGVVEVVLLLSFSVGVASGVIGSLIYNEICAGTKKLEIDGCRTRITEENITQAIEMIKKLVTSSDERVCYNAINKKKILISVATQLELNSALSELKKIGSVQPVITNKISYHSMDCEFISVFIVKSQMGGSGVGGAALTTQEAITELKPDIAIMGGIAFGGNKDEQKIGDVLISTKIWEYEPEKITEDGTIPRGAITPASPHLVQMFETVATGIDNMQFFSGLIASGEKLVNNKEFIQCKLKLKEPELIGGEMEGAGFAAACQRYGVSWVLVKGICDWGYEKDSETKKDDQLKASCNAFRLIADVTSHLINR